MMKTKRDKWKSAHATIESIPVLQAARLVVSNSQAAMVISNLLAPIVSPDASVIVSVVVFRLAEFTESGDGCRWPS